MVHIPGSFTSEGSERILCCYVNTTSQHQIIRMSDIPNGSLERVVFSGQCLLFEALPQARLEIYSSEMASAVLADTISCNRLQVEEGDP
jgi:hypothetical protein